jgi:hypothetical protein
MRLIKSDADRRISLPGVPEPVPRPVDIESAQTGFRLLRTLRVYRFPQGTHIDGHAEEDEVYIAVLSGAIELVIRTAAGDESRYELAAPESSASAVACVAYLPVHGEYQLTARTDADVAYARATPQGARPAASFPIRATTEAPPGSPVLLDLRSHAERLRLQLLRISDRARQSRMDLFDGGASADGALLHVRSKNNGARLAVVADGRREKLHDGDTVAIGAGERAALEGGFGTDVLGMLVWAE